MNLRVGFLLVTCLVGALHGTEMKQHYGPNGNSQKCRDYSGSYQWLPNAATCVPDKYLLDCDPCVYDEQCVSGWCDDFTKTCYPESGWQNETHTPCKKNAQCGRCKSKKETNLDECRCYSRHFPDNWVICIKRNPQDMLSQERYGKYKETGDLNYERLNGARGVLDRDDQVATGLQCTINYFRQAGAKLPSIIWDMKLAKVALEELQRWKKDRCRKAEITPAFKGMHYHYKMYNRKLPGRLLKSHAQMMIKEMYDNIQYYQYPGENKPWNSCPLRNQGSTSMIEDFRKIMSEELDAFGCDYESCDTGVTMFLCIFNKQNADRAQLFSKRNWKALNDFSYNKEDENIGGLPSCDPAAAKSTFPPRE